MKNNKLLNNTYIYENKEVKLTGRAAQKQKSRGAQKVLVEIVPFGLDPDDKTYCKWVDYTELFLVTETTDDSSDSGD